MENIRTHKCDKVDVLRVVVSNKIDKSILCRTVLSIAQLIPLII